MSATRFRGSIVTSYVSRGWPFDSLSVTESTLTYKSLMTKSVVKREAVRVIEFYEQRSPLVFGTFVVARLTTGAAHPRMLIPWRSKAVRRALEALGWPTVTQKVTARQMLRSPGP